MDEPENIMLSERSQPQETNDSIYVKFPEEANP